MFRLPKFIELCIGLRHRAHFHKGTLIVIPIAFDLSELETEISAFPEIKWTHFLLVLKFLWRIHRILNLVENLLAILEQEHFTFILRMGTIRHNKDVGIIPQLPLLLPGNFLACIA